MWSRCFKYVLFVILSLLGCITIALSSMWYLSNDYTKTGIPVINYHQVNDSSSSALTVTTEEFREQMEYLHSNGYHTISLDELYNYLVNGAMLPEKPVIITFDDGYTDNYEQAFPILRAYHMKATVFMISDAVNTSGFLTSDQLKTMEHHHFYIEGHTEHHKILTQIEPALWENEINGGKASLSTIMNKDIQYLAYPGGFTNQEIQKVTKNSGYKLAFTVDPNTVKKGDNLYALPRIPIFHNDLTYVSFLLRIHCTPFIHFSWKIRDWLVEQGYNRLASHILLF